MPIHESDVCHGTSWAISHWDNWDGVVRSGKGPQQENMAVHEHRKSLL